MGDATESCGTPTPAAGTSSPFAITTIDQCNNAGGTTTTCTVTVTNNLSGYPADVIIDSTVRQCQNEGADTATCVATTPGKDRTGDGGPGGQSVTQCNDSGGPGGTLTCTVTAPDSRSTGLPITITQCEDSGTEGGTTVTCTATITNNINGTTPDDGNDTPNPTGGGPGGGSPGGGGPGGGTGLPQLMGTRSAREPADRRLQSEIGTL